MSATISKSEPAQLRAGETLHFVKSLSNYPADNGWNIAYSFRGSPSTKIDFTSTPSGKDHSVTVAFSDTAAWLPGIYFGTGTVTDGTTAKVVWTGQLQILPNLSVMDGGIDTRNQNRRILDNVRAVIEGRASSTILNSEVEGTRLDRLSHKELMALESTYNTKVRNEEIELLQAQGKPTGRTIYAHFTRPK